MYRGRNETVARLALCAGVALALSGCVQATRHSNAIVFGTNTSLGINLGVSASSVPALNVGYNRQEAVFLPVVANTGEARVPGPTGRFQPLLSPCNINQQSNTLTPVADTNESDNTDSLLQLAEPEPRQNRTANSDVAASAMQATSNPCLLVARAVGVKAVDAFQSDAYSVLASFGGRGRGGSTEAEGRTASIAVAQYFATGLAAQMLASEGGAQLVSTGADAPNPSPTQQAVRKPGETSPPQ